MSDHFPGNEQINLMALEQRDSKLHKHDFLEMVYVTKGKALHRLNDSETIVEKGDYFIIDYGAYHKYSSINNIRFEIINVLFKPEMIDKTLMRCRSFQDLINHYLIRFSYKMLERIPTDFIFHDDDQSILNLIEKMQYEFGKKNSGYVEMMRCYLIEIIISTMRRISKNDAGKLYNDYSRYIIDCVEENYMKPITLTRISSKLNYSLPYISKKFKNDMGMSFNEYLQKKRIEQSCRLISNTEKKISEIAELVGYRDVKFFNHVFKKHLKMTPREFKKIHS
jgi:AraC family transcriptional regulator, L-rhamnose operon transcriptional activator RhaR